MSAISFKNVSKRFKKLEAVDSLTMEIPRGQVTAFLGPNGAGKTTTIKLLLGLHRQDQGEIEILGVDSRKLDPKIFQKIAYVSEGQKLPLWMTVCQLLDYCRPLYPTWDEALEKTLLEQFELDLDQKLKNLSRGQLMKASLLSNLAYRPELVILDEPFSGLDALVRDEFIRGLLEFTEEEGWTVFISSHDIEEVERLADNVAVIDQGTLRLNESTENLLKRFRLVEISVKDGAVLPTSLPAEWLDVTLSGRILRFTHSDWSEEESSSSIATTLGGIATDRPTFNHLSLREIFVALAKNFRLGLNSSAS